MLRNIDGFLRLQLTRVVLFLSTALLVSWVLVSRPPSHLCSCMVVFARSDEPLEGRRMVGVGEDGERREA